MSEARDRALAQLEAATGGDELGTMMKIGAADISAVRRDLDAEEALSFAGGMYAADGLGVEGMRLTVSVTALGIEPFVGGSLTVEDKKYTVRKVLKIGGNRRVTLTRFVS